MVSAPGRAPPAHDVLGGRWASRTFPEYESPCGSPTPLIKYGPEYVHSHSGFLWRQALHRTAGPSSGKSPPVLRVHVGLWYRWFPEWQAPQNGGTLPEKRPGIRRRGCWARLTWLRVNNRKFWRRRRERPYPPLFPAFSMLRRKNKAVGVFSRGRQGAEHTTHSQAGASSPSPSGRQGGREREPPPY